MREREKRESRGPIPLNPFGYPSNHIKTQQTRMNASVMLAKP